MKFALFIIASLVATVYGQPSSYSYYTSGLRSLGGANIYRTGISSIAGLGGLGYGYGLGYGTGHGYRLGYGRTIALAPAQALGYITAAPAVSYVAASPAIQTVAAPAVSSIALAAPAVQTVAAPAVSSVSLAAPAIQSTQIQGPVSAAIESRRSVEVIDVPSTQEAPVSQTVVIGPNVQPINLEFQTQASPLAATQNHLPTPPAEPQQSSYEEQPDLLRQDIVKPVVQDVHETIVPYRRITQELKPVQETLHQILPRGEQRGYYQQQVRQQALAVQAAPAIAVQAAPALRTVAAAPAVALAAPAVQTVAVQAAPAIAAAPTVAVAAPATTVVGTIRPAGLAIGYGSGQSSTRLIGTTGLYGGSYGSSYSTRPAQSIGYSSYTTYRKKK